MDLWAELYEAPAPLAADWGHQRIYAPVAYKVIRTRPLVPIVHTEVLNLAAAYPVCWAPAADGPTLCVLRSLLGDGVGMPGGIKAAAGALPLAFQAYPIVVPHDQGAAPNTVVVDRAIADQPTDIGAPLLMNDGQLARAAKMRVCAAQIAGRILSATQAISRFLDQADLLEPWPLQFDLGGNRSVDIRNLKVVSCSRLDDSMIYKAIAEFGVDAALFLSTSRLSLFRISALLAAAKSSVALQARETPRAAVA